MEHKIDPKPQCQTCFVSFDTAKALHSHIWAYQVEVHRLSARIQEAQLHLPTLDDNNARDNVIRVQTLRDIGWTSKQIADHMGLPRNQVLFDGYVGLGENDDDDDDSHGGNSNDNIDIDDGDADGENNDSDDGPWDCPLVQEGDCQDFRCPHPECDRIAEFKGKPAILRHYTIHVSCYELCVFCREPFTQVRKYISHNCKMRCHDEAKTFYTKERCSQLRKSAEDKLSQAYDVLQRSRKRCRKRQRETMYQEPPRKRQRANADGGAEQQARQSSCLLGNRSATTSPPSVPMLPHVEGSSSLIDTLAYMQPTPAPSLFSGISKSATPTVGFSNADFSACSSFTLSQDMAMSGFSPERIRAPIFRNDTMPPSYHVGQQGLQSCSFPSNTADGGYQPIGLFTSSSLYTLADQVAENLGDQ